MAVQIERMLFTTDQYEKMIEAGVLTEDDRVELLRGEIVNMAPIGLRHSRCVAYLDETLGDKLGKSALVWPQNPVRLANNSMPEPDLTLLRRRGDFYGTARPTAEDILLLIEVADSTLSEDRLLKVPLYAEAGIPEVWIVNLIEDVVETYTNPVKGAYTRVRTLGRDEMISPQAFPNAEISVNDIVGALQ